jgi:non-ribosomal peptide synthase protein (TIGR01720 family)
LTGELKYWQDIEKMISSLLPRGQVRKKSKASDCRELVFQLCEEYTEKLLKQVNKAYNTEINDILLTALGLALSDWAGKEKIPIILEGHGREEIVKEVDITRTVGWFTSVYPVVLDMAKKVDIADAIKNTKEMLRHIPHKGIGYGILRYLTKEENKQGIEFRSHPDISFNYLGQFDEDINSEVFQVANISPGNSVSLKSENIYNLYISGMISGGKLGMSMRYDPLEYEEEKIPDLVNGLKKRLQQIIAHCMEKEGTELTLSDLSVSIDEQEADLLFDALSDITLNE